MENSPPIHLLPNELLVKIIEKLPRTQWPSLELVDKKLRDAVLLAWGSVREVDMERDFIYSEMKAIEDDDHDSEEHEHDYESDGEFAPIESWYETLRLQDIAQKTKAILKKLIDYSPFITSLCGLALIPRDPNLNTAAIQYLAGFEHLETIKFVKKYGTSRIVNGERHASHGVPLINFIQFIESTRSRATLKEIDIDQCDIPNDPVIVANFDQRLRAAFANDPNDLTRSVLQLESFSMRMIGGNYPLNFFSAIDASKMTKLSLGDSHVEPTVLTTLIIGAPRLQHIDFAFLYSCDVYDKTNGCQGGRLQPNKDLLAALASHQQLTSLGINSIWSWNDCACHRFEPEFKTMLRTIGRQLHSFIFKPWLFPPAISMGEIRDIIQNHMPQLKSITLVQCCAKNPEELRGIADGKELEEIVIGPYIPCDDDNENDDDYESVLSEVLSTIINKSPRLKRFNSRGHWPDQRMAAELCKLTDLIDLRIEAFELTEENFVAFSQQVFAAKVQVLHVGSIGSDAESGSGFIKLIEKAAQLRELAVEGNVPDQLLGCLVDSCPNLEKFRAMWADGITFDGLQMFVDRCPNLRWLHVESADGALPGSLKNLKLDRYRKLELN